MASTAWPSCPGCGSEDLRILHEANPEARRTDATLECQDCGHTFKDVLESPRQVEVHAVVSDGAESRTTTIEIPEDRRVFVEDELLGDGHRLLVTSLELEDGRRVRSAEPEDLGTVWCKVFDTVDVPVSVNQGHRTWAETVTAPPEEDFYVGDELTLRGVTAEIHTIKTETGVRHKGKTQAQDIKRIYAETPKEPDADFDDVHRGAPE